MLSKRTPEEINKRCDFLEDMGFEILHTDSRVIIPDFPNPFSPYEFDFSACEMKESAVIFHVVNVVYRNGFSAGTAAIQNDLKKLLGVSC